MPTLISNLTHLKNKVRGSGSRSDLPTDLWFDLSAMLTGKQKDLGKYNDKEIMAAAVQNGICQLIDQQIKGGNDGGLSNQLRAAFSESTRSQAAHDLLLNDATRKLLDLLADHSIPALMLKGTPIAHLFYQHTYLRPRGDTDLYIRQEDKEKTSRLLEKNGLATTGLGARPQSSKQFGAQSTGFQDTAQQFDIHWKLSNRSLFQSILPFEECQLEKQTVPPLGLNAFTLSNRDLLLHACIHRIAHGRNTERNRLIWLYDIHLLWEAMESREKEDFARKALAKKIGALCAESIEVAENLFASEDAMEPQDHEFQQLLTSKARREPTARLIHASRLRWAVADLMAIPGLGGKLQFTRELVLRK